MERTRPRYYKWIGSPGTSIDLNRLQAETLLIETDYVASPLPILEQQCRILNMKQMQCGILVLSDEDSVPIENPIAYALLLNELHSVTQWFITGEYSDKDVFHCHAVFVTQSRTDSLRRSFGNAFDKLKNTDSFLNFVPQNSMFDLLKLQRCQKPESMIAYCMKEPQWVLSNSTQLLQCAYDIDEHGLNERFKKTEPEEQKEQVEMNAMVKDIVDTIMTGNCKTFEQCLQFRPDTMAKYLHRPGLTSIVQNCLAFVKATGQHWTLQLFENFDINPEAIHKILLFQGIEPTSFDTVFHSWLTKQDSKRNTIILQGPSNTGKSAFIQGFKQCVPWGEIVNTNSGFAFEALQDNPFGVWEEPLMSPELAEKFKQVAEGMPTSIPIKYKKPFLLPRTPIIITTNHDIWRFCRQEEPMFRNRCWIFNFQHTSKDAVYVPRISERSCQCRYCQGSRGRSDASGSTEPTTMQTRDESILTGEQSTGSTTERDVGSRSLSTTDGRTTDSNTRTSSSSTTSTTIECSNTSEHGSSSSTNPISDTSGGRSIRSDDTRIGIHHTRERFDESMESRFRLKRDGQNSPAIGTEMSESDRRHGNTRTARNDIRRFTRPYKLDPSTRPKEKEKEVSIPSKKRKLDRAMASRVTPIKLPMYVPLKQDWEEYLNFLYHMYG
ncbi:nonstructural protein 1 [Grus japonensis parvovirus 1]|uniref:Nonstructural protein 1 n=1 Tax=Grus japonensis parvovirus 1 TaxID=3071216 RepID=A0A2K9YN95_9VIRU|nr:nonstructural protein 1 [Parvoviridae sp.]AUW34315.1 nonstructural protein 1 [Grus japonensis parvovirus 1]